MSNNKPNRLFIGVFPTGISYADRKVEEHGDYKKLAFLPYRTLELEWYVKPASVSLDVWATIVNHAAALVARRGEDFQVSTAGQTVRLGGA